MPIIIKILKKIQTELFITGYQKKQSRTKNKELF